MVKKSIKFNNESSPALIGLDIGYGETKAITQGKGVVKFPSVAGHYRPSAGDFRDDELSKAYPGDLITDDSGKWVIGARARKFLKPGQQFYLRGRTADEESIGNAFRVRFALAAIGKLFAGTHHGEAVHIKIATGLPVEHMGDAADLKAALIGQHPVHTDAAHFVANITDVYVMPQPYGTIYANTLTSTGDINECHTARRTGVVDIGTYTIDLALDDASEYVDAESGSVEAGVSVALDYIATQMKRRYKMDFKQVDVEAVLKAGCFTTTNDKGEIVQDDFSTEVLEALAPVRDAALTLMGDKWKTGANVGVIYLTGGVAGVLHKQIKSTYRQTQVSNDPQTDNARGFLHYAIAVERDGE